jgi:hypothetical protein
MDQANNAAVRRLVPPTPRSRWLAPSVTTLLYYTTVSQTLRASFSERRSAELTKIHLPIEQAMYACIPEMDADFSKWCALSGIRPAFLLTHPAIRGSLHASTVSV